LSLDTEMDGREGVEEKGRVQAGSNLESKVRGKKKAKMQSINSTLKGSEIPQREKVDIASASLPSSVETLPHHTQQLQQVKLVITCLL
jgi:hypothetical protein